MFSLLKLSFSENLLWGAYFTLQKSVENFEIACKICLSLIWGAVPP